MSLEANEKCLLMVGKKFLFLEGSDDADAKCLLMVGKKWTSQSEPILSSWLTGGSHDLILLKMDFKILATTITLDFHSPSKV